MSEQVPAEDIERIVGIQRHATRHYANAVSIEQTVYILHSERCKALNVDLRDCLFSHALDNGIDLAVWEGWQDQPVRVTINRSQRLIPTVPGMKVSS